MTRKRKRRLDFAAVKDAARGRWAEILPDLLGWPAETCDGRNRPCPRCEGENRFRFTDYGADGSALCNQCAPSGIGDGFDVVAEFGDVTKAKALRMVANWLCIEGGGTGGSDGEPNGSKPASSAWRIGTPQSNGMSQPTIEAAKGVAKFQAQSTADRLGSLARDTGVPAWAWSRLGIGYADGDDLPTHRIHGGDAWRESDPAEAWVIPECDGRGEIVGYSCRALGGAKGSPKGGKRGLALPSGWRDWRTSDGPIFVVEGASDTAALIAMGQSAIGRPSNTAGAELLAELMQEAGIDPGRLIVVGDNDRKGNASPGRDGAKRTAEKLARLLDVPIRWAVPMTGFKDVREFFRDRFPRAAEGVPANAPDELAATGIAFRNVIEKNAQAAEPPKRKPKGERRADGETINAEGDGVDEYEFDRFGGLEITTKRPLAQTLARLTSELRKRGDCFVRAEQFVVIRRDGAIRAVLSTEELAGLVADRVDVYRIEGDEEGSRACHMPLAKNYASVWLHGSQREAFPEVKTFTRCPAYVVEGDGWTDARRIATPGFDAASGVYYAGPIIEPRAGTGRLDTLLADFCFRTVGDRSNYVGLLLTQLLIRQFIGSHPAGLFNGNQPGVGKTILSQILSIVRDGRTCETVTYNPKDDEFEKRLGAAIRSGSGVVVVDNAKAKGRSLCIESPSLERSITDETLSFRLLGTNDTIRAENSIQFCLTANASDVSRDLITRSIVVNLWHEGDPGGREFRIDHPEGFALRYRDELLGELAGMIDRWRRAGAPLASTRTRFNKRGWGNVVGGILAFNRYDDFLTNAGEAAAALDETRREFAELVGVLADHPQGIWTAAELVKLCCKEGLLRSDLGDGSERSQATKLGTIAGRFVGERFALANGRTATFNRTKGSDGNVYRVGVESATDASERKAG